MHVVDADTVHRLLDYPSLNAALRDAHRADAMPLASSLLLGEPPDQANMFVSLVAWAPRDVIAVKLVGVFPGNLALPEPEPAVQGLVAVFDSRTGRALLVADGAAMTFRKTAADSALGATFLARPDAASLLVVGAGGMALHVIMAHLAARPSIRQVQIWNRTLSRAQTLARTVVLPGVFIEAVTDLDAAVAVADIISCVTMATAPLVHGSLLKPGAHVDLIGAYLPGMREADDDVVRRADVFVDVRDGCDRSGEIAEPIARGLLTLDGIKADLFDLCTGRHSGRIDPQAITMYKNAGGAHLDLFTARFLLSRLARHDPGPAAP